MKKKAMPSSSKPGIKRPKAKEDVEDDENDDGDPGEYGDEENGDDGESEDDEEQEDGEDGSHEGDEEPSEEQEALKEDQIIAIMHQVLQKVDALGQMLGGGAPQMPPAGMGMHPGMGGPPPGGPAGAGGPSPVDALVQKAMGR